MSEVEVAAVGALIGDASRARMLDALMAGRALTAGELASVAGIGRPAASEHLQRLLGGGLVDVVAQGRHRYYRLAGPEVAHALEALSLVAPPARPVGLRAVARSDALAVARTCYDHLAGEYGVRLHDGLLRRTWIVPAAGGYDVTAEGVQRLADLGVDVAAVRTQRRSFARPCLDWTQRREHLAGALAAALTDRLIALDWFRPRAKDTRVLRVTAMGAEKMAELDAVVAS